MSDALTALTEVLGEPPPPSVAALPDAVVQRLADQIRTARRRRAAEIDQAVDTAVNGVPLPVRGVVRKALLG